MQLGIASVRGLVPALFLLGCSATSAGTEGLGGAGAGGPAAGGGTQSGAGGGVFFDGGSSSGEGGPVSNCSEEAKLVYVVGQGNELYSFAPKTLTFTLVGVIACPTFAQPFSMAVDRSGIAWVLFNDGVLFHVDVKTAACVATTYVPNQAGFSTFGMGFVSNAAGSNDETLFIANYAGTGIGKIDTATFTVSPVGGYDALFGPAELTGTGDARLYGFFQGFPVIVAEIDRTNAKILSQAPQPTVNIGSAWAFAFWGGDFWLFTNPTSTTSQVDRYRPADGTTTTVKQNVGLSIVGAGVSTCAPIAPPE